MTKTFTIQGIEVTINEKGEVRRTSDDARAYSLGHDKTEPRLFYVWDMPVPTMWDHPTLHAREMA